MARRSPVEVDARNHAARELRIQRRYRSDETALEVLAAAAAGLASEAANMLVAGDVPMARRYARAHQLIAGSRRRLLARRSRHFDAARAREAAAHGIQAGETVRVTGAGVGTQVPTGTVVTVDRVHGRWLYTGTGREARVMWAADVERVTEPEPTVEDCGHLRCKQMPGGCEMYDAPRTVTATPAGRDRDGNPITRRVTYVIDRRPEPFGEGCSRIFSENRTLPDGNGGYHFTPDVVLTDSIQDTTTGDPR